MDGPHRYRSAYWRASAMSKWRIARGSTRRHWLQREGGWEGASGRDLRQALIKVYLEGRSITADEMELCLIVFASRAILEM